MKTNILLLLSVPILLAGCVAPKVTSPAPAAVSLRQYPKVKVVVTDSVNSVYSKEGVPMLEGLLKGKLQSLGYTPVDANPQMIVDVQLTKFEPGERALRMFFPPGVGRAECRYTASVKDASGSLLAEMEGGKMYHGREFIDNPMLKSQESMRMGMITHSVSQIGKFIRNNGRPSTNLL
jgi:hypothetical protein